MNITKKIIIDTDIGTNADDAIAIALAMSIPEIEVLGITTVCGNTELRSHIAQNLLSLLKKDVPVFSGISASLLQRRSINFEERPIFEQWSSENCVVSEIHAVTFLIDTIMKNPHQITLVAIGPLTNIAAALIMEPKIAENVKEIIMMGGVTRLGSIGKTLPPYEYNISADPEAAELVFNSKIPITMLGLDVTYQILLTQEHIIQLRDTQKNSNLLLVDMLETWMKFKNRDISYMCDPLTILYLIAPHLFDIEKMNICVSYTNDLFSGCTQGTLSEDSHINVCLEIEKTKIMSLLMDILLNIDRI